MDVAGRPHHTRRQIALSLTLVACAAGLLAFFLLHRLPSEEASIDADVVHVASAVGGRIVALPVRENDAVKKGELLFQIDPVPYQNAVNQAAANVDVATATLETQRRTVSTQQSSATIAAEQTRRAQANLGLSARTEERLRPLTEKGYVPQQQFDQAQVALKDATTSLRQAREQEHAARNAVGSVESAEAALRAAEAALANARHALEETTVRAPHDGRVTGLTIATGEMVVPSQSLFNLIGTQEWFAIANLREVDLQEIRVGDCATVYSMIDRSQALKGVIQSIGWGVLAEDKINLPRSVPYVKPSLNWVHVAQRFPVRVKIEQAPEGLLRLGASALVEVGHGAACR